MIAGLTLDSFVQRFSGSTPTDLADSPSKPDELHSPNLNTHSLQCLDDSVNVPKFNNGSGPIEHHQSQCNTDELVAVETHPFDRSDCSDMELHSKKSTQSTTNNGQMISADKTSPTCCIDDSRKVKSTELVTSICSSMEYNRQVLPAELETLTCSAENNRQVTSTELEVPDSMGDNKQMLSAESGTHMFSIADDNKTPSTDSKTLACSTDENKQSISAAVSKLTANSCPFDDSTQLIDKRDNIKDSVADLNNQLQITFANPNILKESDRNRTTVIHVSIDIFVRRKLAVY